jgi:hypothetical protein
MLNMRRCWLKTAERLGFTSVFLQIDGMEKIIKEKMVSRERIFQYILKDKQSGGFLFKQLRTDKNILKTLWF